jgi:hypothetical protein
MKTILRKIFAIGCLSVFGMLLLTPAQAARGGTSPIIVITIPKPVVSAF